MDRRPDIILRPPVATAAARAISPSIGTATGVVTSPGRVRWRYDEHRANRAGFALTAYAVAASAVLPTQALAPVSASVAAAAVAYVLHEPPE